MSITLAALITATQLMHRVRREMGSWRLYSIEKQVIAVGIDSSARGVSAWTM